MSLGDPPQQGLCIHNYSLGCPFGCQQKRELASLRAEVERLRAAVDGHNNSCERMCKARDAKGEGEAWTSRGKVCCDCPRDWMIEGTSGQQPGGQS